MPYRAVPSDATGWVVPMNHTVACSATAAVLLRSFSAWPSGIAISFHLAVRHDPPPHGHKVLWSGAGRAFDSRGDALPLRIGLAQSDGVRLLASPSPLGERGTGTGPRLLDDGTFIRERLMRMQLWWEPLPPAGEVTLYVTWPAYGIDEASATFDCAPLLQAAEQSTPLWPDDIGASGPDVWPPDHRPTSGTVTAGMGAPAPDEDPGVHWH